MIRTALYRIKQFLIGIALSVSEVLLPFRFFVKCLYNVFNQSVPHHIIPGKMHHADAVDAVQDLHGLSQAGLLVFR